LMKLGIKYLMSLEANYFLDGIFRSKAL